MSRSGTVAKSATWVYGAQVGGVVVQFAYAAVTSRTVAPDDFGAYSVALAVTALIVLMANGGLAQTVARLIEPDPAVIRGLVAYGVLLGLGAAALLWFTAPFWAALWGVPAAAGPIRLLTVNTATAPLTGLATGLARRNGQYRALAVTSFVSGVVGLGIGVVAVLTFRNTESLLVGQLVSQTLLLVVCLRLSRGVLTRLGRFRDARGEFGFSAKVVLSTVLAYLGGNVGKWSISFGLGAPSLGQWNRAEVVSTVPFQYVQDAMMQAIYPEFRHDREGAERARRLWADLLALTAWTTLPVAGVAAGLLPVLVPLLFGPGWRTAALLSIALAAVGGIQVVVSLLYNALEAIGRFRSIWSAQLLQIALNGSAAVLALLSRSFVPLLAATILGLLVQHALQLAHCRSLGYLDLPRLLRQYALILTSAVLIALVTTGVVTLVARQPIGGMSFVVAAFVVLSVAALAWRLRRQLPPVRLLARYGLLPARFA